MHTFLKIITTILIVLTFSCADTNKVPTKNEHPQGSKGGICYPDFTCDTGLACVDNICEEKIDLCLGIVCDEWKVCNMDNGACILRQNRCDRTSECSLGQECNASHYCITPNSQCDGVTCSNQGSCIVNNELPVCICNTGYHADGLSCIQDVDPCLTVTCDEWMQCVEGGCNLKQGRCIQNSNCMGTQICDTNHNCVDPVNPCTGVTCSGFGDCAITNNNAVCVCDTGYHPDGLNCVEDVDLCEGITCSNHGSCAVTNNAAVCVCNEGYHTVGLTCVQDVNPCAGITCSGNGTCAISNNNPVCVCNDGFKGNTCNECEVNRYGSSCLACPGGVAAPCSSHGTCNSGITGNGQCVCNSPYNGTLCDGCIAGYHLENGFCVEDVVDFCLGVNCNHGECLSDEVEYVCVCDTGWTGDFCNTCATGFQNVGGNCIPNYSISWCITQSPKTYTKATGAGELIYGQIYVPTVTNARPYATHSFLKAQVCYSSSSSLTNPVCTDMSNAQINPTCANCGTNNEEYMISLSFDTAGTYYYYYQFSIDSGVNWKKCDTDGVSYDSAQTFETAKVGTATITGGTVRELFISEYIEGSSNDKAIEIYNPNSSAVDLSSYKLWLIQNGGEWKEKELILSGTLNGNSVYVVANEKSATSILAQADITTNVSNGLCIWNGDDAVALVKNDIIIDVIGTNGTDPGTSWSVAGITSGTLDHTLVRKSTITSGNINWSVSAGTNETDSEWIIYPNGDYTHLGSHP